MTSGEDSFRLRRLTDIWVTGYLLTTALLAASFQSPGWQAVVLAHLGLSALIYGLRFLPTRLPAALRFSGDWYPVVLLPLLFKEVELLAAGFGNWGLTSVLQRLEVSWFGGHPSLYLSELLPWVSLSEYLHFCYFAYLFLIPGVGGYWYFTDQKDKFRELVFLVTVILTSSYLFFGLFPVDSPFYLFPKLGAPFEGHFFYELVHFVSGQGGARGGAFPSSHVSVATMVFFVVLSRDRRLAFCLAPIVAGLIVATVYGRFHYVVDALAGLAFATVLFGAYRSSLPRRDPGRAHPEG